jgi:nucleoside phosphorylase
VSPASGAAPGQRVAVVLTALGDEYRAVREHLEGPLSPVREVRGSVYEQGDFTGASGPWRVVLAQTGAGNTSAGIQLERAVTLYEPEVALFVGIAGGRKDVALGDVVAADRIYDYESGKETEEDHLPRIGTHQATFRLVQWAQRVADDGDWRRRIRPSQPSRPPAAFVRPLAAGSVVVAHQRARIARLLDRNCGDALAVEMEGYGFLQGAYMNDGTSALVVRGVSDLLSGKTGPHDELWQPLAARNAAAFAYELLSRLPAAGS